MMSGYIKELLLDYGLNRLSIEQRSDISAAINGLIEAEVFNRRDIEILHSYVAGYTATEIAEQQHTTTDKIETILIRIIRAIENASGYTDTALLHKARLRYSQVKITELSLFLFKHGQRFFNHDLTKG